LNAEEPTLAKMSDTALLSSQALSLLNDRETNANDAFVGQPDAATGNWQGGISEIHDELQLLATIWVSTRAGN
jgi:hypothetical protein